MSKQTLQALVRHCLHRFLLYIAKNYCSTSPAYLKLIFKGQRWVKHQEVSYVYFRMPSNFDVQMITVLSADPEAKRFPKKCGSPHK